MRTTVYASLLSFVLAATAQAGPAWTQISFATTPQNAPKVLAAADALMSSKAGKEFPGKLLLQVNVADGANPATHTFVPIYRTAAAREAFVQKLQADPAWQTFLGVLTDTTQPHGTVQYRVLSQWGDIVDTDHVWMAHAFDVSDPAAFAAALEKFMMSATGKKFPGQVYLSAVVAGGITPVSHVISVGYASEAEMESWTQTSQASPDWQPYLDASGKASTYLGGSLARDLKSWGKATLAELVGR